MRALWSRVSQIPGTCKCASSVSNATITARRRASSGVRGSWAFGGPTSTFLYTTVFAAGLTIDARAKSERNRRWDEAFAQLQEALNRPSENAASEDRAHEPDYRASTHGALDAKETKEETVHRVPQTEAGDATTTGDDIAFDSRMPGTQALAWPANTGRDLLPYNLPPQSLWAPDTLRWAALRRRQTQKKLFMQGLSTGLLVHDLIRKVNLAHYLNSAHGELTHLSPFVQKVASLSDDAAQAFRMEILSFIKRLHLTKVDDYEELARQKEQVAQHGIPSYVQDSDGDFYGISKQMNEGIANLLRQPRKRKDRDEALVTAKICHNLLVSTAAPDLQTFNILMSGYLRWCHHNVIDDIITAFDLCKIRPNEFAIKQILGHYAAQSRPEDFSRFVAKMRGVGDALSLANPAVTINEASQGRLIRVSEDKVLQKVHPTPMVFAALIDGVLQFAGFDRALDVYYEMKADGWGLTVSGLTRLLADCIRRADWEGGTYVWEEINTIKAKSQRSSTVKAYYHMLSLCSVTGNTVAFNQVLNEVAKRGFDPKAIIKQAMETTRRAQHTRDNLAPAWAADNLMIAVSGYLDDRHSNETFSTTPQDEVEYDDKPFTQMEEAKSENPRADSDAGVAPRDDAMDPKEVWSRWVEHELGETPKDPEP